MLFMSLRLAEINSFLSHSGYYNPNSDTEKEFFEHNCLWDRNHIKNEESLDLNIYAVHGHTVRRFPLEENKPKFFIIKIKNKFRFGHRKFKIA